MISPALSLGGLHISSPLLDPNLVIPVVSMSPLRTMRPEYLSDIDGLASPVLNIPEEMDVEMWAQEDRAEGKNNEEEFQEDNDKGEDDGKAEEERWPFLQDLLNEYNPFTVQSN